jgi:muramoyltetrapeptide carboxypeptidase LdcA involved in peptidoglycan recycling
VTDRGAEEYAERTELPKWQQPIRVIAPTGTITDSRRKQIQKAMKGNESMKVTTVSVQMSRTISKNYHSFQNSVAATATEDKE